MICDTKIVAVTRILAGAIVGGTAVSVAVVLVVGCSTSAPTSARLDASTTAPSAAVEFDHTVKPLIKESCAGCHNPQKMKGDLDLERFLTSSPTDALQHREIWEAVASRLRAGEMPPEDEPAPPAEQVATVAGWIEKTYASLDAVVPVNPGRVTVRRLNRVEYNNTVRDLLGVTLRVADEFPPDASGYGFDNIGDVLSLSPVLTEGYLKAAERVANAAIPSGVPPVLATRYNSETMGQQFRLHIQTLHDATADGLYNFRVGWEQGNEAGSKFTGYIYVDGKEIVREPVVLQTYQDRSIYAKDIRLSQGTHLIEARMKVAPDSEQPRGRPLVPPYPTVLEIFGPFDPTPKEQTKPYQLIFFKGPPGPDASPQYARDIFAKLMPRAYRRQVASAELEQIARLTDLVRQRGDSFEEAIRIGLTAVLLSPNFLFRIEQDPLEKAQRISDSELASRLSYFLWSTMPDDILLSLAAEGHLHEPEILRAQVQRMIQAPKSYALASNFAGQWLQIRNLETNVPDRMTFPVFDLELRDAMRKETELFFQAMMREDRNVLDFLDGNFTFVNERLAQHYGIPGVEGREFRRVELGGSERSGILTHASVLTVSSYPTRTSPVIRGKWVLENILNTPPPAPPPNVPALDDQAVGKTVSLRQQLEKHRASAECAACHARMDPLGFGLENYDAIGRWRTEDGALPVDVTGRLPNGTSFNGARELKAVLRSDGHRFVRALAEKLFTYGVGRGVKIYDRPALDKIVQQAEAHDGKFTALIEAIVESKPFQMRSPAPAQTAASQSTFQYASP